MALHLRLPAPKGVVFFLHGNGGSLESWFINPEFYRRANYDLFMIDYRGYGKSTGQIESEAQLRADVRAAWATVAPQYAGRKVVFYGRSLGTGLAAVKGDVSKKAEFAAAVQKAKIDSPRGPFSVSKAHNPVQDIYLRQVSGKENKLVGVASKSLADPARGCKM